MVAGALATPALSMLMSPPFCLSLRHFECAFSVPHPPFLARAHTSHLTDCPGALGLGGGLGFFASSSAFAFASASARA